MFKQIYILPILLFFTVSLKAQVIYNSGFELWATDGPYPIAENWTSSNEFTWQFNNAIGVYSNSIHSEGKLAAQLSTANLGFAGQPYAGWIVNGFPELDMNTGKVDFFTAGTSFSGKPNLLSGYYIYENNYVTTDSAYVTVIFKKFNSSLNQSDTIALGYKKLGPTVGYINFEVEINDILSGVMPDSMIIAFTTTDINIPLPGASLWIDDLSFKNINSVNSKKEVVEFYTYPNPADDKLFVDYKGGKDQLNINIYNFVGNLVKLSRINSSVEGFEIGLQDLPEGAYIIEMKNGSGISKTQKLIIRRT